MAEQTINLSNNLKNKKMKKLLQLLLLLVATFSFSQTPIQTFNFEDNLTNAANNITLNGSNELFEVSSPGKGQALRFNQTGTTQHRVFGSVSNIPQGNSSRTFSFWLKVKAPVNNTDVNATIFYTGGSTGSTSPFQGFGFYRVPASTNPAISASDTRFEIRQGTHVFASVSGPNGDFNDKWRFYTISFTEGTFNGTPTGGNFRIYIDGVLVTQSTVPGEIATFGTGLKIGGDTLGNIFSMDKFNIYNGSLTPAQVTALYVEDIKPVVPSPQAFCSGRSLAAVDVQEMPNVGATLRFYRGTTPTPINNPIIAGDYLVSQVIGTTESNKAAFTVTLTANPAAPSIASTIQVCVPNGFYDVQDLPIAPGTNIKWYSASTGGSPLTNISPIVSGTTYYASQTVGTCESTRTAVLVNTSLPAAPIVTQGNVSLPVGSTIANLVATPAGFVVWYSSEANATNGTNPLAANTVLQNNTTYYGKTEISSCRSAGRTLLNVILTGLSISDFNTSLKFSMYPNPATNILNIDIASELKSVEIYSLIGQKLLSGSGKQINISNLSSGMYMVRVQDIDGGVATQKMVKE
jgi:hypothetical protein